ncbi:MAG: hypothetical protein KC425_06130, partial [Anaerolineales bacterium]|nr:hypothetical protein [Anaerolineales bacterium]
WTAPANLPVAAALGLTPQLDRDAWAELFASRVNLLRREARDFRLMSAHTLADDPALLQLSVRRLLILLRKIALERGMDYVFETNDERLRQGVQLSLEETLTFLFERGAFAGATPRDAFRVVTDDSLNTRQRVEQGQFIAQIQVAPSQPLEFITVLLLRLSEGLRAAEV